MDRQTLESAFRELIKQRKWYINSLRSPVQAKNDKATFLKGGKIPEGSTCKTGGKGISGRNFHPGH